MLTLQGVTYSHPNKDILFSDLNLVINKQDKVALIGNNGAGKSTLLQLLAGHLQPAAGLIAANQPPYYIPQLLGQYNGYTVAQALRVADKLAALQQILDGQVTEENLTVLNDDWTIEKRCQEAFAHWQLQHIDLNQSMSTLSGGQKTKVFLAGILIHQPDIVLLDEPSNHLDVESRAILNNYIRDTKHTLVVVSHDRTLLNLLNVVYELSKRSITVYGGNYDFYAQQKQIEREAQQHDLQHKEKSLRKAKETEREALERQQKLEARGRKKQDKAGLPTILLNTFKNNAERTSARLKGAHADKIDNLSQELQQARQEMPDVDKMRMDFDNSALHKGKILVTAQQVNVQFDGRWLWQQGPDFLITSGERIAIKGANGSGKTTLIKLMLGQLEPATGHIDRAPVRAIYIDQDYSLINNQLSVYQQVEQFNESGLQEHEIKIRLNRFLFTKDDWNKACAALSGGEKMRLLLCSLTVRHQAPDIIVLDEPTNNLDMQNIEILTAAINEFQGTLLVISHDEHFLNSIHITRSIHVKHSILLT